MILPLSAGSGPAGAYAHGITDPLNIPDPMNPVQNVGRNCFRFFQVQAVFRDARQTLLSHAASHPPPRHRLQALADAITRDAVTAGWLPHHVLLQPAETGYADDGMAGGGQAEGQQTEGGAAQEDGAALEFPLLSLIVAAVKGL
jgi:hypothetical protein